jgi:hypothetical protein
MQTVEKEKYFTDTKKNIPFLSTVLFFYLYICRNFV